jgi:hypothetical protein
MSPENFMLDMATVKSAMLLLLMLKLSPPTSAAIVITA